MTRSMRKREERFVKEGLCQRSSTPHWHHALQTSSAGLRLGPGRSLRMLRRISCGRELAGILRGGNCASAGESWSAVV